MIYMFLADGFEEIEALCPLDLIRRAKLDITTVGIGGKTVCGSHGIKVIADIADNELDCRDAEMVILPGGMPGTLNLGNSEICANAVLEAHKKGAFVAAICAAPSVLGKLGLLVGKKAVCFPGFEDELKGAEVLSCGVCRDENIITGAGMGVAFEFGLALVEAVCGKPVAEDLFVSTQASRR